ncbi:hypothetical protein MNBD_PLANCTO02-1708 [hydrothermal vent metagenome]|uniref:Uncharacterized protein n=1 Tax=hydrothermal vent metagenome TaxID=652676 RepID=A0A3B1E680_9ZZZZ
MIFSYQKQSWTIAVLAASLLVCAVYEPASGSGFLTTATPSCQCNQNNSSVEGKHHRCCHQKGHASGHHVSHHQCGCHQKLPQENVPQQNESQKTGRENLVAVDHSMAPGEAIPPSDNPFQGELTEAFHLNLLSLNLLLCVWLT